MNITVDITHITQPELRNLVRGAKSNSDSKTRYSTLNHARRLATPSNARTLAHFMCATELDAFYYGPAFPTDMNTVYRYNFRRPIAVELETCFQLARLEYYLETLLQPACLLGRINTAILTGNLTHACTLCIEFRTKYGFSAILARKAIYIYSKAKDLLRDTLEPFETQYSGPLLSSFLNTDENTLYSQYINLSLDVCDGDAPSLEVLREHRRILDRFSSSSSDPKPSMAMMRRIIYPTHLFSILDSHALLFLTSSTALDLLTDFSVASFSSKTNVAPLKDLLTSSKFLEAREALQPSRGALKTFLGLPHLEGKEEASYKASFAFPEVSSLARWRRAIDFELSSRERDIPQQEPQPYRYFSTNLSLVQLCQIPRSVVVSFSRFRNSQSGTFMRTIAVLNRLRNGEALSDLSPFSIRLLLSLTTGFSRILSETELRELREKAEQEDVKVIVFLTMVMLNQKHSTEDLEFEMRFAFQSLIQSDYDSDILAFVDWMHQRTPGLTPAIVDVCDIGFLERLYLLHSSYADVLKTREDICRWAADKLNRRDFIAIADRLALDSKVRTIRGEIDENRILVDPIRYEQWSMDALAPMLRKYERVLSVPSARHGDARAGELDRRAEKAGTLVGNDYWFRLACEEAFKEFCHNRIFGIDSYLSRRIRHGTLAGTLIVPIQEQLGGFKNNPNTSLSEEELSELDGALDEYRKAIYFIRDGLLHFRSKDHKHGLLLSYSANTPSRARLYSEFREVVVEHFALGYGASELCSLFGDHCWELFTEDLIRVQEELRRYFHSRIRPIFRRIRKRRSSNPVVRQLSTELDQTAEHLFTGLLRWFTRSEGSTMTVTVRELLNVVIDEVGAYWPNYAKRFRIESGGDEVLFGLTYQNVYDLLSVLYSNIANHGDPDAESQVISEFQMTEADSVSMLRIKVVSGIRQGSTDEQVRDAVFSALAADSERDSMIREGQSGLGKARALVESYYEGGQFTWKVEGGKCSMEFRIPIILVGGDT